jgi:hypothetical protein
MGAWNGLSSSGEDLDFVSLWFTHFLIVGRKTWPFLFLIVILLWASPISDKSLICSYVSFIL